VLSSPEKTGNAAMSPSVMVTAAPAQGRRKGRLEAICKQRSWLNRLNTCSRKRPSCRRGKGMGMHESGRERRYNTSAVSDFADERHSGSLLSHRGSVREMAQWIARGIEEIGGASARLRTVPRMTSSTERAARHSPRSRPRSASGRHVAARGAARRPRLRSRRFAVGGPEGGTAARHSRSSSSCAVPCATGRSRHDFLDARAIH